uniref:protein-tyrosine-phosphatase n=1 Tax=Rhizochromulina marina TaxID=1034831 RepID=A0A7S2SRJ2_9STRA|mmetsp:Transcript_53/g.180  ORF Transcript_53/g.180 Transcript_53/m.180 type:complete len:184 (+) Transcript_53:159-710(+)|eukprot:CAMPEP_0118998440 /NCGR_PEP_ID=MMETSP1173-20130426/63063_1 /TAXON_ID=1034831 /ORGANISM="Rhizochromulina marina cf, Strain CCMP1243" /LENGTH=183 /DNA_ID=CAMNT_0006949933 /DNA_START=92 /DNA_END=643 /DNA_ORIENTATION=-
MATDAGAPGMASTAGADPASIQLSSKPSRINHKDLKFLIMDRPTEFNLPAYLRELKKAGVTDIVRVCEQTYSASEVKKAGIDMHEIPFDDGQSPPDHVVETWMGVVANMRSKGGCIAIHCVAGLGRAPVLVAIALIEHGMGSLEAVEFIRKERRGAINRKQLDFLMKYTPKYGSGKGCACAIM